MICGSETWLIEVEHEVKLDRNEMCMTRVCGFTVKEWKKSVELAELLVLKPVSFMIKKD